jgi:hypothetical protein
MTLPSFTAESSLFSVNTYYRLSAENYNTNTQQTINSQRSKMSYDERCKSCNPGGEPAESGRRAWSDLERACSNLQCEECRKDCISFINGLHDAINIKLGKPIRAPNDFVYLKEFINAMNKKVSGYT